MSQPNYQEIPNYQPKKNEKFMNNSQLEHFRKKLNTWRKQLVLELRTRDRERKLIGKIDKTLYIIELGDYGFCKTCGAEISLVRLEARPTADECIDCKTIAEKKEV
ncbi:TraR/DksA C4-type zinc finger protein [Candidatus Ruthturnera calyptogenae]|uniref:TraR/DksA C4-type zinc finger protein n=1 Tax=Candidatus Ruthturnera calyptogenae TaxID=386487 RepID=UPI0004B338C3|nr:TraR/DksA C4-type zinc finger protein [Candidatus Ruthturnera calyptogenae]